MGVGGRIHPWGPLQDWAQRVSDVPCLSLGNLCSRCNVRVGRLPRLGGTLFLLSHGLVGMSEERKVISEGI